MEARSGDGPGWSEWLRKLWTGNNRIRLMLTLELAVMLPAAALIYLNYYQLKSLKRDKVLEAAIHRDFHQMLAIAEKQINQKAYTVVEGIRNLFPSPDAEKEDKLHKLDWILSQHPELGHVFLYEADRGFLFRSQPQRMNNPVIFSKSISASRRRFADGSPSKPRRCWKGYTRGQGPSPGSPSTESGPTATPT